MTPHEFIRIWKDVALSERSACQQHFLNLCDLLGQPKPAAADPEGTWYTFERGVHKTDGGTGWADVWLRGHFGWEYKGKKKDLTAAYKQLLQYREDLENPPLLIVCDLDRFEIHTNFTGTVKQVHKFSLAELAEPHILDLLRRVFTDPESLRPGQTTEGVTAQAAEIIGQIADGMRQRGIPAHDAAHFLMKLMFSMFAEDIDLLRNKVFTQVIQAANKPGAVNASKKLSQLLGQLFEAMAHGGTFGADDILHFNGGLFADAKVFELALDEIEKLAFVNTLDWSNVEPSVFGTCSNASSTPTNARKLAHTTPGRADIETLLQPVVMQPLRREWDAVRAECDALWPKIQQTGRDVHRPATAKASPARKKLDKLLGNFTHRLEDVTILDPACGSGNFLYVALNLLLDLEKEVISYAAQKGTTLFPSVRPTQLLGIEINEYAQELASVVIWIGYLQWMHDNGFTPQLDPVLEQFESIQRKDAILDLSNPDNASEPEWPAAEFIVGNPPFLGDKLMRAEIGHQYVETLRRKYDDRLPKQLDLCCYWFEKARAQIAAGISSRAGLLATQGIRGGSNRSVLERIKESGDIFFAEADRDWILDGAIVHVSMVGFDNGSEQHKLIDGIPTTSIHSNLTVGSRANVSTARKLPQSAERCFLGVMKAGSFDISESLAIEMLNSPNPHRTPNSDVLRPRLTARDILQRSDVGWIIDFGCDATEDAASLYELPWAHIEKHVKPERLKNRRARLAVKWWIHGESRPGMRAALNGLARYIVTPEVSKHRVFSWLESAYLPDHQTRVFPFADDDVLGILHSRVHEIWARAMGTQLRERESGFRYTPSTCFETFPFPEPSDTQRSAIAAAAKELDSLRNNWLNPPEWTRTEVLEFPGSVDGPWKRYIDPAALTPDPSPKGRGESDLPLPPGEGRGEGLPRIATVRYPRIVPKDEECAKQLKKRTLTNLYNERPTWLDLAHKKLDAAVFAAYDWDPAMTDDDLLAALLALNLERASASAAGR